MEKPTLLLDPEIVCKFKDSCTEFPYRCKQCDNNRGKRSYFVPKERDYYDTDIFERWRWYLGPRFI